MPMTGCEEDVETFYGEGGNSTTIRAEIHRLHTQLDGVVLTKPYRLRAELGLDLHAVRAALRSGTWTLQYGCVQVRCCRNRSRRRCALSGMSCW
jgi:hypothetical protein